MSVPSTYATQSSAIAQIAEEAVHQLHNGTTLADVHAAIYSCGLTPHEEKHLVDYATQAHLQLHRAAPRALRQNPNDIPAYSMPLRDLVTMWEAKHGDSWVDAQTPAYDEFWEHGTARLLDAAMLEQWNGFIRIREIPWK